jgi:hypothetical protein
MGNITYRYTNGKTFISSRITSNRSRTPQQIKQRKGFSGIAHTARALRSLLEVGFSKYKGGRVMNHFMRYNTSLLKYVKNSPVYDATLPSITNLCMALSDPAFTGKVVAGNGSVRLTPVYNWDVSFANIEGIVYASRNFAAGDVITLGVCYSYLLAGSYFEMIDLYTKKLTEADVAELTDKNQFEIDRRSFPDMDIFGKLPAGFSDVEILLTTILTGRNDSSESFLRPAPGMAPQFEVASQTFDDATHMRLVMAAPGAFAAEVGNKALGCLLAFIDETRDLPVFKVDSLSTDTHGVVDGLIVLPPEGYTYFMSVDPFEGSCILANEEHVVAVFSGVDSPVLMG